VQPNPVLKKLGLANDERVAIIHTDDIGMCQASVLAFAEVYAFGLISSGAVMVPCPWFLEAAAFARKHPQADLGVHLTLTSEWATYRWGPVSTRQVESGLIDAEGYFYRSSKEVQEHGDPDAVQLELEAQIKRACAAGIALTHYDTHMGAVVNPKFIPAYISLALIHGLPLLIMRMDEAGWQAMGLDADTARMATQTVEHLEGSGLPLLDNITSLSLNQPEDRLGQAKKAFKELKPGITHFIIHPAKNTPELRAITPDWRCRVADYETFQRDDLRKYIKDLGVQVIGYRLLNGLMPE
jgi:predicted glycoside hydrolase/deacetylase ChbG (UPF0249 family)